MIRRIAPILILAGLAGCGDDDPAPVPPPVRDPQVAQALNDPLMTDPDLSSRNEAAAALTVESDQSLPVLPATPEEAARARAEAAVLAGGAQTLVVPTPAGRDAAGRFAPFVGEVCVRNGTRTAIWAARMPAEMPIYPRGHTRDATGSDAPGCRYRFVTFTTPVGVDDVASFYAAMAAKAKRAAEYRRAGAGMALAGASPGLRYEVRAEAEGDHTLVRIATLEP